MDVFNEQAVLFHVLQDFDGDEDIKGVLGQS
jgi:hypothetical protein